MRNFTIIFVLLFSSLSLFSQQRVGNEQIVRNVKDNSLNGVEVSYVFPEIVSMDQKIENTIYKKLMFKDFTHTKAVGKPALPIHSDVIAVPTNSRVEIVITKAEYKEIKLKKNEKVYPALKQATDYKGDPDPVFEIDELFYQRDEYYPENVVKLDHQQQIRELGVAVINTQPVQYNPAKGTIRIYTKIEYSVKFVGASRFMDYSNHSAAFLSQVASPFLNAAGLQKDIDRKASRSTSKTTNLDPNYLILTHPYYITAAEKLADWKSQLGYRVEIITNTTWTSSSIRSSIKTRYQNYIPTPDYYVIIGDHTGSYALPGTVLTNSAYGDPYATDLYFSCMNGANDYYPDIAQGRISVSSLAEANTVIDKIIKYEKTPVADTSFYHNATHAAYFQDSDDDDYADRRFAQTAEDALRYMVDSQNMNISRVYYAESSADPVHWNSGSYSTGEYLPAYLQKPAFAWDGDAADINSNINAGALYVLHRDHGYENGWGDPSYSKTNISSLTNGDKTPIIFTINCLTGKFYETECFSERFLRKSNGGAVGVFGHAEISYSGYNDGLALGLFDAIWANPGLVPNFTGSGGVNNPTLSAHTNTIHMGDVKNQALIRMIETWGDNQYTHELFHYFGDPAMRLWTDVPTAITATHLDTLYCTSDTTLQITNSSLSDALATLVVEGELIAQTTLVNGSGVLYFGQIAGSNAILTLSKHNYRPLVDTIIVIGGCPRADFDYSSTLYCLQDSVVFTNTSIGNIVSYSWNYGVGASPATDTTAGPHVVYYSTPGVKTATLAVTTANALTHTYSTQFTIDQYCKNFMLITGSSNSDKCSGRLLDDGGNSGYSNSVSSTFVINPLNSASITLTFNSFDLESGYDYLKIYEGPSTNYPVYGSYTGTTLPGNSGVITTNSGSVTIQLVTDGGTSAQGFEMDWQCNYPTAAPSVNFTASDSISCNSGVKFTDVSSDGPNSWFWDFGDGFTSSQQNPNHTYAQDGIYSVKLKCSNMIGVDSLTKLNYITIAKIDTPNIQDQYRCNSGTFTFTAQVTDPNALVLWYNVNSGGSVKHEGLTYTTPALGSTAYYYAEAVIPDNVFNVGVYDNTGDGKNMQYEHYLVFDVYQSCILRTVKVYASGAGYRTIQLQNAQGGVIETTSIYCANGENRITLDFDLSTGTNYRLVGVGSPDLYRIKNNLSYPYTQAGFISIKYGSATSAPTNYYYYFFDWEIAESVCVSDREKVRAIVDPSLTPISNFTPQLTQGELSLVNTTQFADSYIWDFGDGHSSTLENPVHYYGNIGNYVVKLIATNPCGVDSSSQTIQVLTIGMDELAAQLKLQLFPNPVKENLYISFDNPVQQSIQISLIDVIGKTLLTTEHNVTVGKFEHKINTANLSSGVYFIQIKMNKNVITKKVVVEK